MFFITRIKIQKTSLVIVYRVHPSISVYPRWLTEVILKNEEEFAMYHLLTEKRQSAYSGSDAGEVLEASRKAVEEVEGSTQDLP